MADYPETSPLLARTWRFASATYPTRRAMDDMLDVLLPSIEDLPGYRGVTVLVERETGDVLATVFWEDEASLRAAVARERNAAQGTLVLTGSDETAAAVHDVLINRPAPAVFDRALGADAR
ncbi:MAG: hypothetical protein ACXVWZ_05850 [Nocardioides sp.]